MKNLSGKFYYAVVFGVLCGCLLPAQAKESSLSDDILISVIQGSESGSKQDRPQESFSGNVSWYGPGFQGRKTASGEIFDMNKLTSAHLKLPFGTRILIEDPRTGNTVIVKVNDRGPYVRTRVMDLTREGAHRLGTLSRGVAFVDCLVLGQSSSP